MFHFVILSRMISFQDLKVDTSFFLSVILYKIYPISTITGKKFVTDLGLLVIAKVLLKEACLKLATP